MAQSISYSERCYFTGKVDGLYLWGPDHSLPRDREGGYRHECGWVVLDRRLNQDVEKRPGLDGKQLLLNKKHGNPLGCRGIITSRWWPLASHILEEGQGQIAQMPQEQDTLKPWSGDACRLLATAGSREASACSSPLALGVTAANKRRADCIPSETVLELGINHLAEEGVGWRLEESKSKRMRGATPVQQFPDP